VLPVVVVEHVDVFVLLAGGLIVGESTGASTIDVG